MMGLDLGPLVRVLFHFTLSNNLGSVSGVGSDVFVPTGIESITDVVPLVVFVPRGVKYKGV